MEIRIASSAKKELKEIEEYISQDNPTKAKEVVNEIVKSFRTIQKFPNCGTLLSNKIACDKNFRYIIKYSYAIIYKLNSEYISVNRILHLKRDFSAIDFN